MDKDYSPLVHVVDDEESIRRSLKFLLRTAGYSVTCWATGNDFIQKVDKTVPACVLLDILMPGFGGLEVQQHMIMHEYDFPVIVMSGAGDVTITSRAMMAGALDLIEKPFDRGRLLAAIAAAFDRLSARTSIREEQDRANVQISKLTKREREVLDGLACGYPKKTVANDLGLSSTSVEVYRANAMAKLRVTFFADALRIALTGGLGAEKDWRIRHGVDQRPAH